MKQSLSKHPFILKSILNMSDINNVDSRIIVDCCSLILNNQDILKEHKIAYNNYSQIKSLYKTILFILRQEPISLEFLTLPKAAQIKLLNENSIKWEYNKKGNIVVESESYETTRMIGSSSWCISYDQHTWDYYNKGKTHLIIITDMDIIGVSYNNMSYVAYNLKNNDVDVSKFFNEIPRSKLNKTIIFKQKLFNEYPLVLPIVLLTPLVIMLLLFLN
jgi:hypothetical protein